MPKGIYKKEGYNGTPEERFWRHVHKTKTCWIWTGAVQTDGYGNFNNKKKIVLAHRFSYEIHKEKIPARLLVLHSCDNPPCVNPAHLRLGTMKDNMEDRDTKKRDRWSKRVKQLQELQELNSN